VLGALEFYAKSPDSDESMRDPSYFLLVLDWIKWCLSVRAGTDPQWTIGCRVFGGDHAEAINESGTYHTRAFVHTVRIRCTFGKSGQMAILHTDVSLLLPERYKYLFSLHHSVSAPPH
jgi:hypothetical protein